MFQKHETTRSVGVILSIRSCDSRKQGSRFYPTSQSCQIQVFSAVLIDFVLVCNSGYLFLNE